jgi:hypothetical protein
MADLVNELVWSFSRARAFDSCRRAYWFNYYGSWGGWASDAPAETRDTYVQKKLTTRAAWIGTVVHGVAERALELARSGGSVGGAVAAARSARAQAERDIAGSESGAWLQRPARRVGFAEHYYREAISPERWPEALDEIERQVGVLWGHRIFRRLLTVAPRIRQVEDLQRFVVGDAPVWVVLDVLVEDGQGGMTIVDWKTGASHDDGEIASQLGVYGLYATQELGVALDRVTAMHVNLRHDTETRHAIGAEQIAAARGQIGTSMAEMRAVLVDVPGNVARFEDFAPLAEGDEACRRCNFRGVCGRR